jgi:acetoin utilization protein AcuB
MQRLDIPVDEFTTPNPFSVTRHASIGEVRELMREAGIRHVPVLEDEIAVGIISDRDVAMVANLPNGHELKAEEIMTASPYVVISGAKLADVALEMARQHIGSAVVSDDAQRVIGIFTVTDAVNALVEVLREELDESAAEGLSQNGW